MEQLSSKASKQLTTAYGVHALGKKHKLIRKLRRRHPLPSIHGTRVWGSSYIVMDYLEQHPLPAKTRVMDLGCGWGALAIYCAKHQAARVTAVDADANVFNYLRAQAKFNGVNLKTKRKRYQKIKPKLLAKHDTIVGSDICFWDELTDALFKTIKRAKKTGVRQILIADPGRPPFMKLAKKCARRYQAELIEYSLQEPVPVDGYLLRIS